MSGNTFSFNKPYPTNDSIKSRWRNCILYSTFIFLFLFIFRPFELSKLRENIFTIALGYGMVCFVIMSLLNIGVYSLFPIFFSESNWTNGKEILWSMLHLFLIGIANFFYSTVIGIIGFTWINLLYFETYTLAIGVFPITISVLIIQMRLSQKFEQQSYQLNQNLEYKTQENITESVPIKLVSESGTDEIELQTQNFLFAKADDNYVEIYYFLNGQLSRKIIRNTLKNVANQLEIYSDFMRCHKSYIVNLKQVNHFSGNAQGYKLHLKDTDELVPVSRMHNETIKNYFSVGH